MSFDRSNYNMNTYNLPVTKWANAAIVAEAAYLATKSGRASLGSGTGHDFIPADPDQFLTIYQQLAGNIGGLKMDSDSMIEVEMADQTIMGILGATMVASAVHRGQSFQHIADQVKKDFREVASDEIQQAFDQSVEIDQRSGPSESEAVERNDEARNYVAQLHASDTISDDVADHLLDILGAGDDQ